MYIWRVNKLVNEFRTGAVTERKQLSYLLVFLVISYIAADPYVNSILEYGSMNTLDILMLPLSILIAIAGTVLCYAAAQTSSSSSGFLPRYICLGLPVMIRIVVFVFALMLLTFVVSDYVYTIPFIDAYLNSEQTTIVDVVGICGFEVLYFVLLRAAIRSSYESA
jgi:hypothetical protein